MWAVKAKRNKKSYFVIKDKKKTIRASTFDGILCQEQGRITLISKARNFISYNGVSISNWTVKSFARIKEAKA